MASDPNPNEVRCFCRRKPLLARCGRDKQTREPFIEVKYVRSGHPVTHVVITRGNARIRCRECGRWFNVRIVKQDIIKQFENLPETIEV